MNFYPKFLSKLSLLLITFLFTTSLSFAQESDAILQFQLSNQLKKSARLWNKGDLDGFLADYLQSEEMTFTSGGRVLKGFDALEQRYRKSYGDSTETMGRLNFSDLEVWRLGPTQALVVGRWALRREEAGSQRKDEGVFTLVMLRIEDQWKILHDHTSASK